MYKGQFSKSPSPENTSKWFQIWKAWDLDFFFTVLSCFAIACSIKNKMNLSADPHHFPSWDDPFASILEFWFSIPSQGNKVFPWLWSGVSRKIYWSFLTTQSEFQLGGRNPHCRDISVNYSAIHHCVFNAFLVVRTVTQFCTLLDTSCSQNPAMAPLSSRKLTLFPSSWSLKLVLMDQNCWEAQRAEPGRNKKGKMWCTGIPGFICPMRSSNTA